LVTAGAITCGFRKHHGPLTFLSTKGNRISDPDYPIAPPAQVTFSPRRRYGADASSGIDVGRNADCHPERPFDRLRRGIFPAADRTGSGAALKILAALGIDRDASA
jgi:hypothetical protein